MTTPARMLTVSSLAREFGWDRKTVRAWLKARAVPVVVLGPARRFYDRRDVERAVEAGKARTPVQLLTMSDARSWAGGRA